MTTINPESGWTTCPSGALAQLGGRLRARRRTSLLRESALLILVAALIGVTAGYFASPGAKPPSSSPGYDFAGISCDKVRALLPELMAGRIEEAQAMQIRQHVMQCPECGPLMEQMSSGKVVGRAGDESPRVALIRRPAKGRIERLYAPADTVLEGVATVRQSELR